jgi:hypothetical protein
VETAIARQRLASHVSAATDRHKVIEELVEVVISVFGSP